MTDSSLIEAFNTHNLPDDKVRALMIAREPQRAAIMAAVHANLAPGRGKIQHVVLRGPRGFGKSFMARVIELDVAAETSRGAEVCYLLLPEEQHNLARSPDALLRFFESRLRPDADSWLDAAFTWPSGDALQRWREAEAKLEAVLDQRFGPGRGLAIAVIENFDHLLKDVFSEAGAEERLRKWMTRPGNRVMLFVTTTQPVDLDYDRALFQAFRPVALTAWTEEDCLAYFNKRRELAGKAPLDARTEAKARAVATFIGGNPRLAQLLSNVLEADDALSVAGVLDALADELADYYRRRIDDLAPLARGLLDALIRGGEPSSVTALAKRVGTDQKTIARAFSLLTNSDIVTGHQAKDSKEKLFHVRDRVFVHFYRLRYGATARDTSPLRHIVELLQRFYETPEERLTQANRYLDRGLVGEANVFLSLAGDAPLHECDEALSLRCWTRVLPLFPNAMLRDARAIAADLVRNPAELYAEAASAADHATVRESVVLWRIVQAQAAVRLKRDDAQTLLAHARAAAGDRLELAYLVDRETLHLTDQNWAQSVIDAGYGTRLENPILRAEALLTERLACVELGQHGAAFEFAKKAEALAQSVNAPDLRVEAGFYVCNALRSSGHVAEALEGSNDVLALAQSTRDAVSACWIQTVRAICLLQLGRGAEAVDEATRAADAARKLGRANDEAEALCIRAECLFRLDRYAEGATTLQRASTLVREPESAVFEFCLAIGLKYEVELEGRSALAAMDELLRSSRLPDRSISLKPEKSLRHALRSVTLGGQWSELLAFAGRETEWLAAHIGQGSDGAAEAITRIAVEQGRAQAFAAIVTLVDAAAQLEAVLGADAESLLYWLPYHLAGRCDDDGLLEDFAGLLEQRGGDAQDIVLLRDFAAFHRAGRSDAALERLDPDRAALIRRLWPSAQPLTPSTT